MEKLRVEKKDIYTIEVNDDGDTIEFDLLDIGLKIRIIEGIQKLDILKKTMKMKEYAILKRENHPGKVITKNEEDLIKMYDEGFKEMREIADSFLGKNACQKIFGDRNYIEMFEDLFDALAPHLEKMQLNSEAINKRIIEKYTKNSKNVI